MAQIFDGKAEAEKIINELCATVSSMKQKPSLGILRIGNRENQQKFTEGKKNVGEKIGVNVEISALEENASQQEAETQIQGLASTHTGVLLQLPIPEGIDQYELLNQIPYEKDVEGLGKQRMGEVLQGLQDFYSPVAMAAKHAIDQATQLRGKNVTIVGNNLLLGRPLFHILEQAGATVTVCNSKTNDLSVFTRNADIVVSSTGKKHLITKEMIKKNSVLIDTGYEIDDSGNMYGDFAPDCAKISSFFTPVPGGIGPLTVAFIFKNLLTLTK